MVQSESIIDHTTTILTYWFAIAIKGTDSESPTGIPITGSAGRKAGDKKFEGGRCINYLRESSVTNKKRGDWRHWASIPAIAIAVSGLPAEAGAQEGVSRAAPAEAATPLASANNEILVIARRREENLQETPVSVLALSGEDLDDRSISNLQDLSNFTPNVRIAPDSSAGDAASSIFIRGIGQTDYRIFSDPGVATYVDGVFIPRAIGGLMDALDLERIEVLRGPQGTLYGKNSVAGAINLISRRPSNQAEASLRLTVGSNDRYEARGSANVPIADNLFVRAAGLVREYGGWGEVITDRDSNNQPRESARRHNQSLVTGRMQILWQPVSNFEALLSFDGTRSRSNGSLRHPLAVDNRALGGLYNNLVMANGLDLPLYNQSLIPASPYQSTANYDERSDLNVFGSALTMSLDVGAVTFRSVSSYRELDNLLSLDADGTAAPIWQQDERNHQEQYGQEFQISGELFDGRLNFVNGLFYFKEKSDRDLASFQLYPIAVLGLYNQSPQQLTSAVVTSESIAIYGQGSFDVTDKLSFTLGGRWNHEKKSMAIERFNFFNIPGVQPVLGISGGNSGSWEDFSPRIGLEYQWTDDVMTFASLARGFKSGGFNGRPSPLLPNNGLVPFDPETVTTYEMGLRSMLFDRHLRFNVTAFYSEYDDIQTTALQIVNGQTTVIVGNAAAAEMKGVEIDFAAFLSPNFVIDGNFGYIDAKYTDITGASTLFLNNVNGVGAPVPAGPDSVFPQTPKYTFNVGAELTAPMAERHGNLKFRADLSYQSSTSPDTNPARADAPTGVLLPRSELLGARTLINARMTYTSPDDRYQISAYVTNLTDKVYRSTAIDFNSGFGYEIFGPPRQWGLSALVRF